MCTAISFSTKAHYFGRNLDLEYHYEEAVVITPRQYPFSFRKQKSMNDHYGIIGIATVANNYPLYYDAVNEMGLCFAALNFPGNAVYQNCFSTKDNIAPFELIPWILGQCKNLQEALTLLDKANIVSIPFNEKYPLTPLHWLLSDKSGSVTIEPLAEGLKIYRNPIGVLTNNPPFPYHMWNLNNYLNLTREEPENRFSSKLDLEPFSRGMGGIGLPGDLSSPSRFIKAAFTKWNSVCDGTETGSVCQFFHILESVAQQCGCVRVGDGYEKTVYSSCCNTENGVYYYKTYENNQITAVKLTESNLNGNRLTSYPLILQPMFLHLNP